MVRTIYTDCLNAVKEMAVNTTFKGDRVLAQAPQLDRNLTIINYVRGLAENDRDARYGQY